MQHQNFHEIQPDYSSEIDDSLERVRPEATQVATLLIKIFPDTSTPAIQSKAPSYE